MSVTNIHASQARRAWLSELRHFAPARAIVRSWRALVGPGWRESRTLVACSGGADSSALALALAGGASKLVIGHVVHDLRPRAEALADRDGAAELASFLGAPFVQAEAHIGPGNAEAGARKERYRALAELAAGAGASLVVTGHHADDQLESVLMAMLRGAGPAGLRGVSAKRTLTDHVTLLRPMLNVTRAEARDICDLAGWRWREDATNTDTSRLRAALRHGPLAALQELAPGSAKRVARSASLLRGAVELMRTRAAHVFGDELAWERERLRGEPAAVLGEGLRRAALRLSGGGGGDALGARVVDPVIRAIEDEVTEPRTFHWPGDLAVEVRARQVRLIRRLSAEA